MLVAAGLVILGIGAFGHDGTGNTWTIAPGIKHVELAIDGALRNVQVS